MVRAILDGTKTQTRRLVKPQPTRDLYHLECVEGVWRDEEIVLGACPYGQPGDRLWVREEHHILLRDCRSVAVRYLADDTFQPEITIGPREAAMFAARKRPLATTRARFMWRCLSRITLEITDVRVEMLHDITEIDAMNEGVFADIPNETPWPMMPSDAFCHLWESINGPDSWAQNPWVWVISFKRI